jgi:hypothetical protein
MKINKTTVVAAVIIIAITAYAVAAALKHVQYMSGHFSSEAPAGRPEEEVIYNIPENSIPKVEEIEQGIRKAQETLTKKEEAKRARKSVPSARVEEAGLAALPGEPVKNTAVSAQPVLPVKIDRIFPTYKERKARESQTGMSSY